MRISRKADDQRKPGAALVFCVLGVVLTACASAPRPDALEAAAGSVADIRQDSQIQIYAGDELTAAEQALQRAEGAWRGGAPHAELEHLAYLTQQRVSIAQEAKQEEIAERRIEQLIEERKRIQLEARKRDAQLAQQRAREAESELERLKRELQAERTERGLVLTLGNILFDVDRASLKPGGTQRLTRLVDFLRKNGDRKVLIEGHTDSTGPDQYNLGLSQRRASVVEDFLITRGIDPTRLVARGYGERFPVATNTTIAGRQQNRRVEIVILDAGEPLPPPR